MCQYYCFFKQFFLFEQNKFILGKVYYLYVYVYTCDYVYGHVFIPLNSTKMSNTF